MANSRLRYRASQFWQALLATEGGVETRAIQPYLSPTQIVLFRRMHPSEQSHAFQVFNRLKSRPRQSGPADPRHCSMISARSSHPFSIWERVQIVLGKHFFPKVAKQWSGGKPFGLQHPFVVAEQHPAWGASLAAQTGASAEAVSLISRHHETLTEPPASTTDRLLAALQRADDSYGDDQ